jgi:integrase
MKSTHSHSPALPKTARENRKSGSEVAQSIPLSHSATAPTDHTKPKRSLARTHSDYWKARLFRRAYDHDGKQREVNDLYVRIQHGGRREFFALNTTNQDAAGMKARDIFTFLKTNGWQPTLAKFKPAADGQPKFDVCVRDFFAAVKATGKLRLRTLLNYQNCFRSILTAVFRMKDDAAKYDYRSGGNQKWRERVDSIRLEKLTPEAVESWMKTFVAAAGASSAATASARRTANTYVRCARSLFSAQLLKEPAVRKLKLPEPLPFKGVELFDAGSAKYISKINVQTLIAAARTELKPKEPEVYKAFLLALFAGMRKGEIDLCEWRTVDWENHLIRLEETEWLHLKTKDSAGVVTIDPEVLAELRPFLAASQSPFVISSDRPPRNDSLRAYYRCEPVFDRLIEWLRSKGVKANKPLHELRKEIGALIATEHGIYAASRFLRHSDITTTARHYADHKARISVGLGKYLDTTIKPAKPQAARNVAE